MSKRRKNKTRTDAGLNVELSRPAQSTELSGNSVCDADHISKLIRDLYKNGVGLKSSSKISQRTTLLRALQFRGVLGLNTFEGTAAGYCRLATRIHELQGAGWDIVSLRETVVGPDNLIHKKIARYVLIGMKCAPPQLPLPLGGD